VLSGVCALVVAHHVNALLGMQQQCMGIRALSPMGFPGSVEKISIKQSFLSGLSGCCGQLYYCNPPCDGFDGTACCC